MDNRKQVLIRIPQAMAGKVDKLAQRCGVTKTQMINVLIDMGMKTYEGFSTVIQVDKANPS